MADTLTITPKQAKELRSHLHSLATLRPQCERACSAGLPFRDLVERIDDLERMIVALLQIAERPEEQAE